MFRLIKHFRLKVCEKHLGALKGRTLDLMSALRYCEKRWNPAHRIMEKNAPTWYLYHSGVDQRYWRKVRRKIWRGVEAGVDLESNAMIWKLYWQRNVCVAKRWVRRPVQTLVRWEPLFIALKVSVFPLVSSHSNKIYVYWMLVVVQRGVDHIWLGISLEEDDSKRSRPYLIGNLIGRGRFKEESTIFDWEIGISLEEDE